jgi:hypothetical protein
MMDRTSPMVSMMFSNMKLIIMPTLPRVQALQANMAVQHTHTQYNGTQGGSGSVTLMMNPLTMLADQAVISMPNLKGQL